jgi:hypothetical protein
MLIDIYSKHLLRCHTVSTPKKIIKKNRKWTFLRKFRWTIYLAFITLTVFVSVCIIIGIATNIHDRYPDINTPLERPESLSEIGLIQKRDCFLALETLHNELNDHVRLAYTNGNARDSILSDWNMWSIEWRKKYEALGSSCRLTEFQYDQHPTMGLLAEIYNRLDTMQLLQTRLVKRFITQYAQPLRELVQLIESARPLVEQPGLPLPASVNSN